MVVLRIFTLLLALGFSAPASAALIVAPYEAPGVQADNNSTDYTQFMCTRDASGNPFSDFGCVDNTGVLCSANTTGICDTQRVPA